MAHFKTYNEFILEGLSEFDKYDKEFPIIKGNFLGELFIRDEIPNMSSISSSLNDYKILNGIREVSFSKSFPDYQPHYYSVSEKDRTKILSEEIIESKEINSLIIAIDKDGPYVLEGGHRFDALKELNIDLFPAKIVLDLESLNESVFEYQQQDISLLEMMDDYFTIGFEIEMDTDHRRIHSLPIPPKVITESKKLTHSIQDRKKIMDIKANFPNLWKEYFHDMDYHYDESVSRGIEIVTNPFNSIRKSKEFLITFFNDFEKQDKWYFTEKTSIHINIGIRKKGNWKKNWNIVKGIIMLSDDYTFKNIETRRTIGYCNSLKDQIIFTLKSKESRITTDNIKEIENIINKIVEDIFKSTVKTYNINLWKLFNKNYVEFRPVGGLLDKNIVIDKLMYFLYCVYLMTSKYQEMEYHSELLDFIKTL